MFEIPHPSNFLVDNLLVESISLGAAAVGVTVSPVDSVEIDKNSSPRKKSSVITPVVSSLEDGSVPSSPSTDFSPCRPQRQAGIHVLTGYEAEIFVKALFAEIGDEMTEMQIALFQCLQQTRSDGMVKLDLLLEFLANEFARVAANRRQKVTAAVVDACKKEKFKVFHEAKVGVVNVVGTNIDTVAQIFSEIDDKFPTHFVPRAFQLITQNASIRSKSTSSSTATRSLTSKTSKGQKDEKDQHHEKHQKPRHKSGPDADLDDSQLLVDIALGFNVGNVRLLPGYTVQAEQEVSVKEIQREEEILRSLLYYYQGPWNHLHKVLLGKNKDRNTVQDAIHAKKTFVKLLQTYSTASSSAANRQKAWRLLHSVIVTHEALSKKFKIPIVTRNKH